MPFFKYAPFPSYRNTNGSTGSYKGIKDIVLGILSVQELLKIYHFTKNSVNFDEMGENGDFDLYFQECPINFLGEKLAYSEIKPYLCIVIAESSYNL